MPRSNWFHAPDPDGTDPRQPGPLGFAAVAGAVVGMTAAALFVGAWLGLAAGVAVRVYRMTAGEG